MHTACFRLRSLFLLLLLLLCYAVPAIVVVVDRCYCSRCRSLLLLQVFHPMLAFDQGLLVVLALAVDIVGSAIQ